MPRLELEDLKGRKITDVRVMPNMPPEEYSQLELTLDDGRTVTIMRGAFELYGDTIVKIGGEIVYRDGMKSYVVK